MTSPSVTLRSESSAFNAATAGWSSADGLDPELDEGGDGVKETGEVVVGVAGSGLLAVVLIEDRLEVRIPSWASFGLRPDLAGD